MKQTKNALAIMKMSAESTSSMMLYYPNGTTLSNGRVKDKSYQVIFLPLHKHIQVLCFLYSVCYATFYYQ